MRKYFVSNQKCIARCMRLFCTDQVKPPEFLKIDEGHEVINEDDKILIMASGTQACIPHMIAIKRMSKVRFRKDMDFSLGQKEMERKMNDRRARRVSRLLGRPVDSNAYHSEQQPEAQQPGAQQQHAAQAQQPGAQQPVAEQPITDWHDYKAVSHKFDCLDYLIEMHGRIMGISLSPCHRYLYINVLPWPRDYQSHIKSASNPPPVGSKLDRYVLDLGRMSFVSQQIHQQNAFVPSDSSVCKPLCVTKHLIASGSEPDNKATLWDRHHGIKVAELGNHKDTVNAIAVNPVDETIAISVSDDMTVRLWRSKIQQKE